MERAFFVGGFCLFKIIESKLNFASGQPNRLFFPEYFQTPENCPNFRSTEFCGQTSVPVLQSCSERTE